MLASQRWAYRSATVLALLLFAPFAHAKDRTPCDCLCDIRPDYNQCAIYDKSGMLINWMGTPEQPLPVQPVDPTGSSNNGECANDGNACSAQ